MKLSLIEKDEQQEDIIKCPNKYVLVVSPPGTGKTVTGIRYAKHIIEKGEVNSYQKILFLTFSKNARGQLELQANELLTSKEKQFIEITNYHSFFKEKVWTYRSYLGLPLEVDIISEEERNNFLYSLISKYNIPTHLERGRKLEKLVMHLSDSLENNIPTFLHSRVPEIWKEYIPAVANEIRSENKNGHIYFDDLGYYFYRIISESSLLLKVYCTKYPVIIADEFQDTSELQWYIVRELARKGKLLVFADELQQIHEWRGASNKRIEQVRNEFHPEEKTLETLHRFKNNTELKYVFERLREVLFSQLTEKINCKKNEKFHFIKYSIERGRKAENKILVLELLKSLLPNGYRKSVGILLTENKDVQDLYRYLNKKGFFCKMISEGTRQHNLARRILSYIQKTKTQYDYLKLVLFLLKEISCDDRFDQSDWQKFQTQLKGKKIEIRRLRAEAKTKFIDFFNEKFSNLHFTHNTFVKNIVMTENSLRQVLRFDEEIFAPLRKIAKILEKNDPDNTYSIKQIIETWQGELIRIQFARSVKTYRGLYVMTVHQAKGKEFDHVIIPYFDNRSFGTEPEEKRKFYVAVTRTKESVTILIPDNDENKSRLSDYFEF